MQREKQIKSGRLLEVDFYPIWKDGRRIPTRAPKSKPSTAEQEKYNRQQAVKKIVRKINANFDNSDVWMHPTYDPAKAPQTETEARRDVVNYIRRVKTKRVAELKRVSRILERNPQDNRLQQQFKKLNEPLRYVGVIEQKVYRSGALKGKTNWHFHIFMTGGIDRDILEDMWPHGMRTNVDRFQPERFGPETAAKYIAKSPKGFRKFFCSKNLKKSEEAKPKDGKISKLGVERLAKMRIDDAAYWEKRYKGYRFIRCFARYNNYNCHWYISVVMYKANNDIEIPNWGFDEWLE